MGTESLVPMAVRLLWSGVGSVRRIPLDFCGSLV